MSAIRSLLGVLAALVLLVACGNDRRLPSILDPNITEQGLRDVLGVPQSAKRVLILSQSSHLDINWKKTFDQYYADHVERVFLDAEAVLDSDAKAYYSVAEMGFLSEHVARHGSVSWRKHAATGRARVVGGGMTTPDTLLPTTDALMRDYLLGTLFAEEHLGARPRAAWLPDSFGHSPTVPDLLSAAGFTSVGFGRADGARHSYEVIIGQIEPILPGATTTASTLRDLGAADFVWRGPGGGEILAHYMPVREYCQGDTIDLAGYALGGQRLGVDHDDDPPFVKARIAEYIEQLTPYQRTPYLFVPIGCDFQPPRPNLTQYARWWNETEFPRTGVWVAIATFEDYMKLVSFHRSALPIMERDITPVWTGFFATRPRVKQLAREVVESLSGLEPFLALGDPTSTALADAWTPAVLANHHDWITGTSKDAVVVDEQLPQLVNARAIAEQAWDRTLADLGARIDTAAAPAGETVIVFNPGPRDASEIVEVALPAAGPLHARSATAILPAQAAGAGRVAFLAEGVPAFGWRTFSIETGQAAAAAEATAAITGDTARVSTGRLDAAFARTPGGWSLDSLAIAGKELLGGASLVWVVYSDTGGLYRIGSERPDCPGSVFEEVAALRIDTLTIVESGPARVTLRGTTTVDGRVLTIDFIGSANSDRLALRVTGSAATDRTIMLRVQPQAADDTLTMGVAGGVVTRPLSHHYQPSLWPAVTWVSRGELAVHLAQSTAVHGTAPGALEWVAFRNAVAEEACDDVGPSGTDDGEVTLGFSLGERDRSSAGAKETAASLALTRPPRAIATDRHAGDLPAMGKLLEIEGDAALATTLKPASRGAGFIVHLLRLGTGAVPVALTPGVLPWRTVTRPDLLERDDVAVGEAIAGGVQVMLDAPITALRLTP